MDEFFSNIQNPYWLLSVVVVGILVNLASNFLQKRLDIWLPSVASRWRDRTLERKAERARALGSLRSDEHGQTMVAFREIRCRVNGLTLIVLSGVIWGLGFVLAEATSGFLDLTQEAYTIAWIVFSLLGLLALFTGARELWAALYDQKLLFDARLGNGSSELAIHSAQYGASDVMEDVTDVLRQHVSGGKLAIPVNNELLGGDPFPHVKKHLIVDYTYGDERRTIERRENEALVLPPE